MKTTTSRRASALYRIARFPYPRSEKQSYAWVQGKNAALNGFMLQQHKMVEVHIPHTHADNGDGDLLSAYFHLPTHASPEQKVPLVVVFTGLDGYRTEFSVVSNIPDLFLVVLAGFRVHAFLVGSR